MTTNHEDTKKLANISRLCLLSIAKHMEERNVGIAERKISTMGSCLDRIALDYEDSSSIVDYMEREIIKAAR